MTTVSDLGTPCCLLDLDILEKNLADMAALCQGNGKKLYPMVKTHKSAYIAARQAAHGADGFLAGTLDEAVRTTEKSELVRGLLGDSVFETFTAGKKAEWDDYLTTVHDWEYDRYFETV